MSLSANVISSDGSVAGSIIFAVVAVLRKEDAECVGRCLYLVCSWASTGRGRLLFGPLNTRRMRAFVFEDLLLMLVEIRRFRTALRGSASLSGFLNTRRTRAFKDEDLLLRRE